MFKKHTHNKPSEMATERVKYSPSALGIKMGFTQCLSSVRYFNWKDPAIIKLPSASAFVSPPPLFPPS